MNRYKPVGWRCESYRHSLAAKGVKTSFLLKYPKGVGEYGDRTRVVYSEKVSGDDKAEMTFMRPNEIEIYVDGWISHAKDGSGKKLISEFLEENPEIIKISAQHGWTSGGLENMRRVLSSGWEEKKRPSSPGTLQMVTFEKDV